MPSTQSNKQFSNQIKALSFCLSISRSVSPNRGTSKTGKRNHARAKRSVLRLNWACKSAQLWGGSVLSDTTNGLGWKKKKIIKMMRSASTWVGVVCLAQGVVTVTFNRHHYASFTWEGKWWDGLGEEKSRALLTVEVIIHFFTIFPPPSILEHTHVVTISCEAFAFIFFLLLPSSHKL